VKQRGPITAILALMVMVALNAPGQSSIIPSSSQNGVLVCSNLAPGSVAVVEWAPTASGPWTNTWAGLDSVTVASNATVFMSVPRYFRVRGTYYLPPNMVLIPAGSFMMGDTFNDGLSTMPFRVVGGSGLYTVIWACTLPEARTLSWGCNILQLFPDRS
jgi:hypothetical protein